MTRFGARPTIRSMKKLAAKSPAVPWRRLCGSLAIYACASGLAVKSAGSESGMGNSFRRLVSIAQAISSFSCRETPTRGTGRGKSRPGDRPVQDAGPRRRRRAYRPSLCRPALIGTASVLPSATIRAIRRCLPTSLRPEERGPRSLQVRARPATIGETSPRSRPRPGSCPGNDTSPQWL